MDRHPAKAEKLAQFIAYVEERVDVVPRFGTSDDVSLVAMFVRDVVGFCLDWEKDTRAESYEAGFLG